MTIKKLSNSVVGFVTTGLHLGYTLSPDYEWQEVYYKEDGSFMAYPCVQNDINPSKIFNSQILSLPSNQFRKDIIRFNIIESWKLQSQQALIETVEKFCMSPAAKREKTTIYIVSATPIGFMSDVSTETFFRTYYTMGHLFCLPCEKNTVELNRVIHSELLNYNGTEFLLQQLAGYNFIELDSLMKTDAIARKFQKEFTRTLSVNFVHYMGSETKPIL